MNVLDKHEQITKATFLGAWADDSVEWREAREEKGIVTGSVIGSIAGLNPWESAVTRYYKAQGLIPNEVPLSMGMKLGKALEQPLLDLYATEHPERQIYRTGTWQAASEPWARANPDALFIDATGELCLIEVKFSRSYWGNSIPEHYVAQIQWYLGVLGLKRAVLVGLIDSTFVEIEILFDQFEFDSLKAKAVEFRKALETETPPAWDGAENTYETARQLNKEIIDEDVEIAEQLGIDLVNTVCQIDDLTAKLNELKSRTLDQMGSAKKAVIETSEGVFTVASRSAKQGGTPYLTIKKKGR